jgi:hypothetical protein
VTIDAPNYSKLSAFKSGSCKFHVKKMGFLLNFWHAMEKQICTSMKDYEVYVNMIQESFPNMEEELREKSNQQYRLNFYYNLLKFSNYTAHMIASGKFDVVSKCFQLAEKIYRAGNTTVKVSLEHIFIPQLQLGLNDSYHRKARKLLPFHLQRSYDLLFH